MSAEWPLGRVNPTSTDRWTVELFRVGSSPHQQGKRGPPVGQVYPATRHRCGFGAQGRHQALLEVTAWIAPEQLGQRGGHSDIAD